MKKNYILLKTGIPKILPPSKRVTIPWISDPQNMRELFSTYIMNATDIRIIYSTVC